MNRKLLILALVCLAQWAVPGFLIARGEQTLAEGMAYRFRTAPVDPVDPFRGRYVALDFVAAQLPAPKGRDYVSGQRLYAAISVDGDGYARLLLPEANPPAQGDWLPVTVQWRDADGRLRLKLPFDRYYLDEQLAPEAERVYREGNRRGEPDARPAWASVRVRRGYAVLEELYIDGVPVRERLRAVQPGG
ncbi:MAG TPA: GDYXXLXY domain-containing protein [Solimonas sp.]|nr:GDYXXLXY domain-containing protein [Solimonas sp.]